MITLQGTLRQSGEMTYDGKTKLKIWVEHESPRDNGVSDLKIEELFLPIEEKANLPAKGSQIAVNVRVYASGKSVGMSAIGIAIPAKKTLAA